MIGKEQDKDNSMHKKKMGKIEDIFLAMIFLAGLLFIVVHWK